jgi:hypothetical protein
MRARALLQALPPQQPPRGQAPLLLPPSRGHPAGITRHDPLRQKTGAAGLCREHSAGRWITCAANSPTSALEGVSRTPFTSRSNICARCRGWGQRAWGAERPRLRALVVRERGELWRAGWCVVPCVERVYGAAQEIAKRAHAAALTPQRGVTTVLRAAVLVPLLSNHPVATSHRPPTHLGIRDPSDTGRSPRHAAHAAAQPKHGLAYECRHAYAQNDHAAGRGGGSGRLERRYGVSSMCGCGGRPATKRCHPKQQ